MTTVTLRIAYEWTCNSCGSDNFCRAIVLDPQSDDVKQMTEALGENYSLSDVTQLLGGTSEDNFVHVPSTVTCQRCGARYETTEA